MTIVTSRMRFASILKACVRRAFVVIREKKKQGHVDVNVHKSKNLDWYRNVAVREKKRPLVNVRGEGRRRKQMSQSQKALKNNQEDRNRTGMSNHRKKQNKFGKTQCWKLVPHPPRSQYGEGTSPSFNVMSTRRRPGRRDDIRDLSRNEGLTSFRNLRDKCDV